MSDDKKLFGLLNGIAKHDYYKEDEITDEFLKGELYPDMSDAEFDSFVLKTRSLLKNIASMDMDAAKLDAFLASQTKKKDGGLTQEQAKVYAKFWKNHRTKIHKALVEATTWNHTLKGLTWRVDTQSRARRADQLSSASALVELQIADPQKPDQEAEVVTVEMNESDVAMVLHKLKDIESHIHKFTNGDQAT